MWYLAEILGLLDTEPEVPTVLHGFTTEGPDAALVPGFRGAEAELHDRALSAVRGSLSPERFVELTEHGAAMTFEAAGDYSLAALDQILSALETRPPQMANRRREQEWSGGESAADIDVCANVFVEVGFGGGRV